MMILGTMAGIMILLIPIALIILIIVAIVKHNKNGDSSSEDFEKSVRSVFVYLILIAMLCSIIGGTILLFNSAINLALPEKEYTDNDYDYYDTKYGLSPSTISKPIQVDNSEKNRYIVNMITAAGVLVICIPLFAYFSKIARKETVKK